MGPAETIGGFTDLFVAIDPKWKIFQRKDGSTSPSKTIDFPFHVAKHPVSVSRIEETQNPSAKISAADTFNKILLENFTPTAFLINEKGDILYTSGKSNNYMQLPRGEAAMNIHKMAREELRYVLGNVIHQARNQKVMASINDIKLTDGKATRLLDLYAGELGYMSLPGLMLVVIEDKGIIKKNSRGRGEKDAGARQAIQDLEKELVYTKQQLHSTIEQMETSLEELKSSNEELQSTNEELQSTNEESLTTKEEMQSLNEELMTVNSQYESKAEELNRLNNDMKNLLDATEIATVFLDNNLEILRYTPQIKKLFNIIPTDVGRPLSDIVSNFDFTQLEDTIKDVIDRLATKTIEVRTKTTDWFTVRVMPYRTLDNYISGVVMTFTQVTGYKQMEFRLKALQNYSTSMLSRLQQPALQLDKDLKVISVNDLFSEIFHINSEDLEKMSFEQFVRANWQDEQLSARLSATRETGEPVTGRFSFNRDIYELSASPFVDEQTNEILLVLITINRLKGTNIEK
jgi:two-component system CheB/CheR fusion protein